MDESDIIIIIIVGVMWCMLCEVDRKWYETHISAGFIVTIDFFLLNCHKIRNESKNKRKVSFIHMQRAACGGRDKDNKLCRAVWTNGSFHWGNFHRKFLNFSYFIYYAKESSTFRPTHPQRTQQKQFRIE